MAMPEIARKTSSTAPMLCGVLAAADYVVAVVKNRVVNQKAGIEKTNVARTRPHDARGSLLSRGRRVQTLTA